MPNPSKPPTLAVAKIERDRKGRVLPIILPRALWSELHIGDRLMVDGDSDTMSAVVEVSADEHPILRLPIQPDGDTHTVRVRRPRGGA